MRAVATTARRVLPALTIACALGLWLAACGGDKAEPPAEPTAAADVARIVFIDQEECCECTRKRTDATWAALNEALEGRADVPVERVHSDSQEAQAQPYLDMRPMMVVPGLYFLDAEGDLVEMLQGELTAEQIAVALRS